MFESFRGDLKFWVMNQRVLDWQRLASSRAAPHNVVANLTRNAMQKCQKQKLNFVRICKYKTLSPIVNTYWVKIAPKKKKRLELDPKQVLLEYDAFRGSCSKKRKLFKNFHFDHPL